MLQPFAGFLFLLVQPPSQVRQPDLRNVSRLDHVDKLLKVDREGVEECVKADDVDDEGYLGYHCEQGQLGGAPRVGPQDVLALLFLFGF